MATQGRPSSRRHWFLNLPEFGGAFRVHSLIDERDDIALQVERLMDRRKEIDAELEQMAKSVWDVNEIAAAKTAFHNEVTMA